MKPEQRGIKILFLCTGNACRSQMAEGWSRHLKSGQIDAYSAGISPHGVDPRAVKAMREAGVDISQQESKHVDALAGIQFDFVITLCDHAHESCPLFTGGTGVLHVGFEDPPKLAREATTEEAGMAPYRRVRDEIRSFVSSLPEGLYTTEKKDE